MNPNTKQITEWRHHRQDEFDAAYLYRELAELEIRQGRKSLYSQLAQVEDCHVQMWDKILEERNITPTPLKPTPRARILALIARNAGPWILMKLLLREEGEEVKKYLSLHSRLDESSVKTAAMQIAKESIHHAETLRSLSGTDGEPWHQTESGGFLRNVVYGFNDGLTANFGLVAGILGADVHSTVVLLSGISGMIADSLSMGASGYLAAKSESEVYEHEIMMEKDEILLMPELEEAELALIYQTRGMEKERAEQMAHEIMKDPQRALEEKTRAELNISDIQTSPLKEGWITGLATAVGAFIPVAPFIFLEGSFAIWTSFSLSMLSHFAVGAARSFFTGRGIFRSGIDMFLVGLGVAAIGYFAGDSLAHWFTGDKLP